MNKLILTVVMLSLCLQLYAQEEESPAMRKRKLTFLTEAELTPTKDFKGRGISFSGVYNFSDQTLIGIGLKPNMMFFPDKYVYHDYFTVDENGEKKYVSEKVANNKHDDEFCMPLYVMIKCTFSKKTNASPFVEIRAGKDVAAETIDLYRAVTFGARFGFKKDYSKAINIAVGWTKNELKTFDRGDSFLFKVGYEF